MVELRHSAAAEGLEGTRDNTDEDVGKGVLQDHGQVHDQTEDKPCLSRRHNLQVGIVLGIE